MEDQTYSKIWPKDEIEKFVPPEVQTLFKKFDEFETVHDEISSPFPCSSQDFKFEPSDFDELNNIIQDYINKTDHLKFEMVDPDLPPEPYYDNNVKTEEQFDETVPNPGFVEEIPLHLVDEIQFPQIESLSLKEKIKGELLQNPKMLFYGKLKLLFNFFVRLLAIRLSEIDHKVNLTLF